MKTLQHIIRRLCRRAEMRYTLAADGRSPSVRAGVVCTYRTTTICCSSN